MYFYRSSIFNLYVFPRFFILHHYCSYLILLCYTQAYFHVQSTNVHFLHQVVSLYIVAYIKMITTIHLCHHHQLCHILIQQNIIQLTKRQSMIIYKICLIQKKQKTSNTNNSTQDNFNFK